VKIDIKGVIVSNNDKWLYDWFEVEAVCPKDISSQIEAANGEDIEIDINSPGGDVYAGSEIYTALKSYTGNSVGRIVGVAASAAGLAAMGVKKLLISPTAQLMIHNVSSHAWGDYRALEHEAQVLKNYNVSISNAYLLKTGMEQKELLSMMNKETWLNAQEALEKGFVDEIMFDEGNKLVASISHSAMIPAEVLNKMRNYLKTIKEGIKARAEPEPEPEPEQENTDVLKAKLALELIL